MKKPILLTTLFAATTFAKADTIDFWHVYYNGKQLTGINQEAPFILKTDSILSTDSITIRYFTHTPCPDCTTGVIIFDPEDYIVTEVTATPDRAPHTFSLQLLKDYRTKEFLVYYYIVRRQPKLLFKIIIE